jgi:hypothetical protein
VQVIPTTVVPFFPPHSQAQSQVTLPQLQTVVQWQAQSQAPYGLPLQLQAHTREHGLYTYSFASESHLSQWQSWLQAQLQLQGHSQFFSAQVQVQAFQ